MSDFKVKMHQIQFRRPRWGSLQRSPDPLARFKGPTSKGREGRKGKGGNGVGERRGVRWEGRKRRGGWEGGGREREGRGKDVEGPGKWSAPGPVLALGGPADIKQVVEDDESAAVPG